MSSDAPHPVTSGAPLVVGAGAHTLLQLAVVAVLARALSPHVFGVFALVLVVARVGAIVGQLGVGAALVQLPTFVDAHVRAAVAIAFVGSSVIAGATALLAGAIEAMVRVDGVALALRAAAPAIVLAALGAAAASLLEREQRFARLALVEPLSYALAFAPTALAFAWSRFDVLALVAGHVARTAAASALLLALRPHPLLPTRDSAAWQAVWARGPSLMLSRIASNVARELDAFVVGRVLGGAALGCYSRAARLTTIPTNTAAALLGRVTFTRFARAQHDGARLLAEYRWALGLALLAPTPIAAALAVLGDDVVCLLLGPRFTDAASVTRVLATVVPLVAAHQVNTALLHATGRSGESASRSLLHAVLVVVGTLAFVAAGLSLFGAALALWGAEVTRALVTIPRCAAACAAQTRTLVPIARPAVVAAAVTMAVTLGVRGLLFAFDAGAAARAATAVVVVACCGAAGLAIGLRGVRATVSAHPGPKSV